jgi:hypothetical protein
MHLLLPYFSCGFANKKKRKEKCQKIKENRKLEKEKIKRKGLQRITKKKDLFSGAMIEALSKKRKKKEKSLKTNGTYTQFYEKLQIWLFLVWCFKLDKVSVCGPDWEIGNQIV